MKRNFKKFNDPGFMKDVREVDCSVLTDYAETGFENFLFMIINLIDKHAILEKLIKIQEKQLMKPWVTKGITKSIKETKYMNYWKTKMQILKLKNNFYAKNIGYSL